MTTHEHTVTETPKLSALMRTGATLHPQVKESYFSLDAQSKVIGTCALGAAYESYYRGMELPCIYPSYSGIELIIRNCGIECGQMVLHPLDHTQDTLHDAITDLNDNRGWTREAIADWLETQGL